VSSSLVARVTGTSSGRQSARLFSYRGVLSTEEGMERETRIELATFSLEGRYVRALWHRAPGSSEACPVIVWSAAAIAPNGALFAPWVEVTAAIGTVQATPMGTSHLSSAG
jgi:hypothetical protein